MPQTIGRRQVILVVKGPVISGTPHPASRSGDHNLMQFARIARPSAAHILPLVCAGSGVVDGHPRVARIRTAAGL